MRTLLLLSCTALLAACNPTVRIEAPDKPIQINMNVNVEVRVKVEKEVEKLFDESKGLF